MSDNTENYFYLNCNQQSQELAEAQYHRKLEEGIELCNRSSLRNKYKLEDILLQFDTIPKRVVRKQHRPMLLSVFRYMQTKLSICLSLQNTGTVNIEEYSARDLLS
ncbi:8639_t:CDS:2, partial [Racocetra persica]